MYVPPLPAFAGLYSLTAVENEPLIPVSTRFLLTTNSALVPSTSDAPSFEAEINTHAYGRYFDLPEVQKAYREQQLIQTPEFTQLDDDASVGGRFRPRVAEDVRASSSHGCPILILCEPPRAPPRTGARRHVRRGVREAAPQV